MARKLFTRNLKSTVVDVNILYLEEDEMKSFDQTFRFQDIEVTEPPKIKKLVKKELEQKDALIQIKKVTFESSPYALPIEDFCTLSNIRSEYPQAYDEFIRTASSTYHSLKEATVEGNPVD